MALEDFGLTFEEETVYRALIAWPVTTTAQVAEAIGTVVTDVAAVLETLAARGLVSRQSPVGHYAAVPPAIALGAELAGQRLSGHGGVPSIRA